MKISNFRNLRRIPSKEFRTLESLVADVDVTTVTGKLWWKKTHTETRQVFKDEMAVNWVWVDTGKWTPRFDVEELYKAYIIQEKVSQ